MKRLASLLPAFLLCASPLSAQLLPDQRQQMDEYWPRIRDQKGGVAAREVIGFALKAAQMHLEPEKLSFALSLMPGLQDRDPQSTTYGNFVWFLSEKGTKPGDLNAVEFTMENAILLWNLHRDDLKPEDRATLKDVIEVAVHGVLGQKVGPDYTNIFLLKTWNLIAIGEAFGRDDLAGQGYQMLGEWLRYTSTHGIPEYYSPTYLGVDIDPLALIGKYARREQGRQQAEAALRFLWVYARASWFPPALRLGGAHARNYDYLKCRGYFDKQAFDWGWLSTAKLAPTEFQANLDLTKWVPADMSAYAAASAVPREVWVRFGEGPNAHATQFVGEHVSLGAGSVCKGPEDQAFVINFAGGEPVRTASYVMDGRGDPYGTKPAPLHFGHAKAHHLVPFYASDQSGPNVLFFSSFGPFLKLDPNEVPSTLLQSHLLLPIEAAVWQDGKPVQAAPGSSAPLDGTRPIFIRYQDVEIGLRVLDATDDAGRPVSPALHADAAELHAQRLTWVHAAQAPRGEAHLLFLATAAEKLDAEGFARFERQFAEVETGFAFRDLHLTAFAGPGGSRSRLSLDADIPSGKRKSDRPEPVGILVVNGTEMGRSILAPFLGAR